MDGTDGIAEGAVAAVLSPVLDVRVALGTIGLDGGIPTIAGLPLAPPLAGALLVGNEAGEFPASVLGNPVAPTGVGAGCWP